MCIASTVVECVKQDRPRGISNRKCEPIELEVLHNILTRVKSGWKYRAQSRSAAVGTVRYSLNSRIGQSRAVRIVSIRAIDSVSRSSAENGRKSKEQTDDEQKIADTSIDMKEKSHVEQYKNHAFLSRAAVTIYVAFDYVYTLRDFGIKPIRFLVNNTMEMDAFKSWRI